MPFSKNIIQDKELSVQIFKDGFSFCTNTARPFFRFDSHKLEQGEALQNLIETYSYLESEKIKGIHFNHFSTFVPKTLYNPKQKETYLNYNIILSKGWTIAEKDTQDNKIKILYPVNKEIEEKIRVQPAAPLAHPAAAAPAGAPAIPSCKARFSDFLDRRFGSPRGSIGVC